MATLDHRITINAAPEAVWKALADLTAVEHYNPLVKTARLVDGPQEGHGAGRHCTFEPKGYAVERVTSWRPGQELGIAVVDTDWPLRDMRWVTSLHPDGKGTQVRQTMHYRVPLGPIGLLLDRFVMRRKIDRTTQRVFEGLKHFVEHGRPRQG